MRTHTFDCHSSARTVPGMMTERVILSFDILVIHARDSYHHHGDRTRRSSFTPNAHRPTGSFLFPYYLFTMENRPQIFPAMKSNEELLRLLEKYPLPPMTFQYGTAGFRYDASLLDSIMIRVGILAAVRSFLLGNQAVGVMVTASHNDESYNGVKIADPNGGMMAPDGEALAVQLANASLEELRILISNHPACHAAVVHVGRDTRCHSPHLSQLTIRAARAMGAKVISHGVVTTPMLHHVVLHANPHYVPLMIPLRPNVEGYYDLLAHSYHNLLLTTDSTPRMSNNASTKEESLVVDCACGVGFAPMERLHQELQRISPTCRNLIAKNAPQEGPLNQGCGSEHVQKEISPPTWYSPTEAQQESIPYAASLDGDADRIVFFIRITNLCTPRWRQDCRAPLSFSTRPSRQSQDGLARKGCHTGSSQTGSGANGLCQWCFDAISATRSWSMSSLPRRVSSMFMQQRMSILILQSTLKPMVMGQSCLARHFTRQ